MIAVRREGRYLLRRSPPGERWAGLWEFLRIGFDAGDNTPPNGDVTGPEVDSGTQKTLDHAPFAARPSGPSASDLEFDWSPRNADAFEFHHTVTRFRIPPFVRDCRGVGATRWSTPPPISAGPTAAQFRRLALSMPARRFAVRLDTFAGGAEERRVRRAG